MVRTLLKRPNLLAYPGALPGFDPSHVAAGGIVSNQGISAVASGGNFTNLLNAKAGSIVGAPIGAVKNIGPAVTFASGTDGVQFSGMSTALTPAYTVATIVQFDAVGGAYQGIFERGTNADGLLTLNSGGAVVLYNSGDVSSGFTPAVNTPYFIAFSGNNNNVAGVGSYNFVIVNLRNGSVFTASGTQVNGFSANGTCQIGNNSNQPTKGKIAAVMYSPSLMSLPQMLQWAQDPWSFWYPQEFDLLSSVSTVAGGSPSGTLAATEAPDVAAFTGNAGSSGTLAVTEAADIAAFTGIGTVSGTLAVTEGADIAAFTGTFIISGTLSVTETVDTAAFTGSPSISGTLAVTEAADIAAFIEAISVGGRWKEGVRRLREKQKASIPQFADIKRAAAVMSKMGGHARAQALTANQRSNIASKAAQARWR